jgi:hypothetical protein
LLRSLWTWNMLLSTPHSSCKPPLHTGGLFNSVSHTAGRYYAMWSIIRWIQQHQEYLSAGATIAEYATKTALFRYLPRTSATYYAHALSSMGFDVESVGVSKLGQCAMEMAVPALSEFYNPNAAHHSSAMDIIHHIIDQIREIAGMAEQNDAGHAKMAQYIHDAQGVTNPAIEITQVAFAKAAKEAYGSGAHWLALALPEIEHKGYHQAAALAHELKVAYNYWTVWARRFGPELAHLQQQANRLTAAPGVGLFITDAALKPSAAVRLAPRLPSSGAPAAAALSTAHAVRI